ncbi:hypothetical protein HBO15_21305 [Pseudomonas sp. WS 5111]|uniref:hypothetical protein n=1 Tax=Pseudomonas sp. WS 5111 TaxID=2717493 RepID=UPI001474939F|nr:hypothetical protein [Pseudomonas sp. WS 5111]NMX69894.1 hypothetical protein [Pseudomonas sp. WS 5111]
MVDRMQRWVTAGHKTSHIEIMMIPVIHALGHKDCELIQRDQHALDIHHQIETGAIQFNEQLMAEFNDLHLQSYLWVLGSYEIIRSICERLEGDPRQKIARDAKHFFERVRMPLAKMATANRYREDSPIAYPALNMEHGVAWQVQETVFITRYELSDTFLNFLEAL